MKKLLTNNGAAAGLALALGWVLLGGCKPANTFVAPPPPEVTVARPQMRTVTNLVSIPGRLQALETVEIRARVSGYLQAVSFEDGTRVEKGQQLCVIEPGPYESAARAAQATLEGSRAAERIAQQNYERRKLAFTTKAISEIDLLTAEADRDAATARVMAHEAELAKAQLDLSYTTNTAPVSGRISRKRVSEGNLVGGPEATLITTLIVEDPIYLYFNVSERDLLTFQARHPSTRVGKEEWPQIQLRLADGNVYPHPGEFDFLDNRVDPETGTIEVRAVFPNPEGLLRPGLYGEALIPSPQPDAIMVPDLAIQRDIAGPYVLVVGEGNKVESRYVTLGPRLENEGGLRIVQELDVQARVVVKGIQRARPGLEVQPMEEAAGGGN